VPRRAATIAGSMVSSSSSRSIAPAARSTLRQLNSAPVAPAMIAE
jgi:hypothetical protein